MKTKGTILTIIAPKLKSRRLTLRLSARELSRLSGVSQSHILRMESGNYDFTVTKLFSVCKALSIPIAELLAESDLDLIDFQMWPALAEKISLATAERGKRAKLARRLGVSRQVVASWLSRKAAPSANIALALQEWISRGGKL